MMAAVRNLLIVLALLLVPGAAHAKSGDAERAEPIYQKRCIGCHGEEGDADTEAAERFNPPPRDFTLGLYKVKTSAFSEDYPNDEDIFRMIRDGMPGTVMPGWGDMLSEQDMWDLVAYLKAFAEIEEAPEAQLDYGTQVKSSPESIAVGRKLFLDGDRCSECHGVAGKGDGIKKLKDDNGFRTWPRNLTKPWFYRATNDPKDIFQRISVGIPGTQMPSFADPKSKKKLGIEERWHIANFVASLAKTREVVDAAKTVIKAARTEGGAPEDPVDPRWDAVEPATFVLVPQLIGDTRFFTPSNDTITVRAAYDDKTLALLLEWDDRTKSIPGDAKAMAIADAEMGEDAVAVQLPLTLAASSEKPYFLYGDAAKPVTLWKWSSGTTEEAETVRQVDAKGLADLSEREATDLTARSIYKDGTWRVLLRRPLGDAAEPKIEEGRFVPISFMAWDGSNSEVDSKHTLTTWYWLLLEPADSAKPYFVAGLVALLLLLAEIWWARSANRRRAEETV